MHLAIRKSTCARYVKGGILRIAILYNELHSYFHQRNGSSKMLTDISDSHPEKGGGSQYDQTKNAFLYLEKTPDLSICFMFRSYFIVCTPTLSTEAVLFCIIHTPEFAQ